MAAAHAASVAPALPAVGVQRAAWLLLAFPLAGAAILLLGGKRTNRWGHWIGVLVRRNALVIFMCVELMLNAVNLAFVAFARLHANLDGQVIAFFVMVVAAAEVVVGLAILMAIFRARRSASVDDASLLKY